MPEDQIQNLKSKLFGKSKGYDIIDVYHYLMMHYGYIPFEDFKKMDAYVVDELVERLNEMNKKANKSMPKGRMGRRR